MMDLGIANQAFVDISTMNPDRHLSRRYPAAVAERRRPCLQTGPPAESYWCCIPRGPGQGHHSGHRAISNPTVTRTRSVFSPVAIGTASGFARAIMGIGEVLSVSS